MNNMNFVKDSIGENKFTLRFQNISLCDGISYQCLLDNSVFSDMVSVNLSVAAIEVET